MTPWVALFCCVLWGAGALLSVYTTSLWVRMRDPVSALMNGAMAVLSAVASVSYGVIYFQ